MLNFSAWLWMPWKACVFSYRCDSHRCLFAQMDCSPQRYKQADRKEKCVLLGFQRTQTTLSDIQRGQSMVLLRALMTGKIGCRAVRMLTLIKSYILMEAKWTLACAWVEKHSTSCKIILVEWKPNTKHRMLKFKQLHVAVFLFLFSAVTWSSARWRSIHGNSYDQKQSHFPICNDKI